MMINMAFKTITLPAGSICIYKEYNIFKRLWAKFKKEQLPYNKITLFNSITNLSWISENKPDWIILVPKKPLNRYEIKRLNKLSNGIVTTDLYQVIDIYNKLRRDSYIDSNGDWRALTNNSQFKEIDPDEIANEYCYGIRP